MINIHTMVTVTLKIKTQIWPEVKFTFKLILYFNVATMFYELYILVMHKDFTYARNINYIGNYATNHIKLLHGSIWHYYVYRASMLTKRSLRFYEMIRCNLFDIVN